MRLIADGLTLVRAVLGLPLLLCLQLGWTAAAWLLLALGALSDALDGWAARRAGGGSVWGARLDPLADKLLVSAAWLWLAARGILPVTAIWLILTRELLVSSWRSGAAGGAPAAWFGKAKTALQLFCLLALLWPPAWGPPWLVAGIPAAGWWAFWPALALTLISGLAYLRAAPAGPRPG
jgi:CDP-diacylglycerol--glycerol-3-phosphate 3-phosphatidyltransferase